VTVVFSRRTLHQWS